MNVYVYVQYVVVVRTIKDKQEDMDVSLTKEGLQVVAVTIFRTCLQPNHWTCITPKLKNLCIVFPRIPLIIQCGSNGLVMALVKSLVVFDVFPENGNKSQALKITF